LIGHQKSVSCERRLMNGSGGFRLSDMKLKSKLVLAAAFPLICVVVVGLTAMQKVNSLHETTSWVEHTHEAIQLAQEIQGSVIDLETGLRGYLISGKEEFLEPFHAGKKTLKLVYSKTHKHVADNPDQL